MAIVSCPECGKKLKIADTSVGKKVKGPCGHVFVADMADAVAAPLPKPAPPPKVVAAPKPAVDPEKVYVSCTECGAKLKVATTSLGKKMKCPKCTAVFVANLPEEAAPKKPAPEVEFDEEAPAPKPAGKAKAVVKDEDMDDFLSFAQADAAAEAEKSDSFSDADDLMAPMGKDKGKAKKSWDDDEDEDDDDMPMPKGKAGKKPIKPTNFRAGAAADAKPVYPSRLVPTLLATVLLLGFAGLVGAIFFGVNIAKEIGLHNPVVPQAKLDLGKEQGKGTPIKDKKDNKDTTAKDKPKVAPVLTAEEKIAAAKTQLATLSTAVQAYKVKNSEFPPALNDLLGTYLQNKDALLDPWMQPYQYDPAGPKNDGKQPDIWTASPDNKEIGNWPAADTTENAAPKLDGTWIVESASEGGLQDDSRKGDPFIFADGQLAGLYSADPMSYTVDSSANPASIKIGNENFAKYGIVKLDGGKLHLALTASFKAKTPPKNFDEKKGTLAFVFRPATKDDSMYSRGASSGNLKTIALSMGAYHWEAGGKLMPPIGISRTKDPDGKAILSWRVAILPFMGEEELYKQFDLNQPWDHPTNMKLIPKMPKVYEIPFLKGEEGKTHYRAFSGPGAPLEPVKAADGKLVGRFSMFTMEGTSIVMAVVEASEPTIWTKPDDLVYDPKGPLPKLGVVPQGFGAAMVDGTTVFVKPTIKEDALRVFLTCNNGKKRDWTDIDNPLFRPRPPAEKRPTADPPEKVKEQPDVEKNPGRSLSSGKLKKIGTALHDFHDANKGLPAAVYDSAGKPILSWRVAILPYIGQKELHKEFDLTKPWDDPHNKKLLAKIPDLYVIGGSDPLKGLTYYRALVGPGTVLEPTPNGKPPGRVLANVADGTANCIAIVEADDPIEWTRPDDLPYDPKGPLPKFGIVRDGFNALFADASVRFIPATVPAAVLRPYLTCDNGMPRLPLDGKEDKGKDIKGKDDPKDKDKKSDDANLEASAKKLGGFLVRDNKQPGAPVVEAHFPGSKIADDDLKFFANLPLLRKLNLASTPIKGAGLKHLAALDNLEELDLGFTMVDDEGVKELAPLKKLKVLSVLNAKITDSGLITIAGLTQLEGLSAGQNKITGAGVKELGKLKELRRLELGNSGANDEAFKEIAGLDKLEKLVIFGTQVTDAGMKDIAKLKNLKELAFSFNITDAGVKELAGLTELRSLRIVFSKVTDNGMKTIGGFKKLETLEVSFLDITDAGLKEIAGSDQLKFLHLDNTKITDAGLKILVGLNRLEMLTLRQTKVSPEAVAELKKSLPKCQIYAK